MAKKRASAHLTLVLIGSVTLAGCSDPTDQRDLYANRADCVRDWGDDDKKCEPAPSHASGGHTGYYYGPRRHPPRGPPVSDGPRRGARGGAHFPGAPGGGGGAASHAIGTAHVSRGGFGSSAGFHSGGG